MKRGRPAHGDICGVKFGKGVVMVLKGPEWLPARGRHACFKSRSVGMGRKTNGAPLRCPESWSWVRALSMATQTNGAPRGCPTQLCRLA